jgi:hypothetical protein
MDEPQGGLLNPSLKFYAGHLAGIHNPTMGAITVYPPAGNTRATGVSISLPVGDAAANQDIVVTGGGSNPTKVFPPGQTDAAVAYYESIVLGR